VAAHLRNLLHGHTVTPLVAHGYPHPSGLSKVLKSYIGSGLGSIVGYNKPLNHESADGFFYQHYDDHVTLPENNSIYQISLIAIKTPGLPFHRVLGVCANESDCKLVLMTGVGYKNTHIIDIAESYYEPNSRTPIAHGKRRSSGKKFRHKRTEDIREYYDVYCGKYGYKSARMMAELAKKYHGLLYLRMILPYDETHSIICPKINPAEFDSTIEYHLRRILPVISEPWYKPVKVLANYRHCDYFGFDLKTNKWKYLPDSYLNAAKVVD